MRKYKMCASQVTAGLHDFACAEDGLRRARNDRVTRWPDPRPARVERSGADMQIHGIQHAEEYEYDGS
jgi:hypothetical protein